MDNHKPQWMISHEAADQKNFDDIRQSLQRIEVKIDPIFDNYMTASRLGKWLMAVAVFISVIFGAILSLKALFLK